MKKTTFYLLLCLCTLACKKKDEYVIVPSQKQTLQIDKVINDSTIVLSWNKFAGKDFKQYRIIRTATYLKNNKFDMVADIAFISTDINTTSFTETKMPLAKDINYVLCIDRNDGSIVTPTPYVTYQRPNSVLFCMPTDVLFSKEQKKLYIIEQQKIHIVDYTTGRPVLTKEFPAYIGYCALSTYNGNLELYVPLSDGWVQILDAGSLELKDKIYVAGFGIGSVLALNGKVYASSSDRTNGYSDCVKVYDRESKALLGRTGYSDQTRIVALEGSNVEMIDITINVGPTQLYYYSFTPDGIPLTKKEDTYHGDFPMSAAIVRSFPDGSRFITSSSGTVFNKSLVFDRYIKQYTDYTDSYTDFAFNTDASIIYAANGAQKKIDIIRYPSTTNTGNYPTKFSPYKLFRNEDSLIVVSKVNQYEQSYILVENIKL